MKRWIVALLIFCSVSIKAQQYQKPYFNTLSVQSGLPEANIQAILEDKNGYLWMGTQNGLVRYDGYQLKPYPITDSNGNLITGVAIMSLKQDRKGTIWAFTFENGIYYYASQKDRFIHVHIEKNPDKELVGQTPRAWFEDKKDDIQWMIMEDVARSKRKIFKFNSANHSLQEYSTSAKGNCHLTEEPIDITKDNAENNWLGTDNLISKFDEATQSFKPYFTIPGSLKGHKFAFIMKDPADEAVLWLLLHTSTSIYNPQPALFGKDILRLNTHTKTYQLFTADSSNPKTFAANYRNIFSDSLNRVWLATEKGISLYNNKSNNFTNYPIHLFTGDCLAIASDKQGNLWIGGSFQGLYYLNTTTGNATFYASNIEEGGLPYYNFINRIFFDRSGTLWVNMPWFGIAHLNKQRSLFASQSITTNTISPNTYITTPYNLVGVQGDSICFIADTVGLYAWHPLTNRFDKIDIKPKEITRNISCVVVSDDDIIWIGTFARGIYQYKPANKSILHYQNVPGDSTSLIANGIGAITAGKNGVVWIGTIDKGLCSFDPGSKKFTSYPFIKNDNTQKPVNKLDDQRVISMLLDEAGILWIGTNFGSLNRFDPQTNEFTSYLNRNQGFFCIPSLFEDSKKRLWAGTYQSGLFQVDKVTGKLKRYTEDDGLLHNMVLDINEDAMGNIWSLSERGLSRLNLQTGHIDAFARSNKGLEGNSSLRALYKDTRGIFYVRLTSGIMRFDPADLKADSTSPSVVIESVSYQPANAKTAADTALYPTTDQNIELKYNENKISFRFVALHFADAVNNQYAYQLVGYDKDWVQAGAQRTATYTNLSPGNYTFKVKASNSDGVWNETGTSINITILPPWWKTWWAYLLYAVIFIIAISSFIAYRSAALKKENKVLEEKVELRTTQLQTSIADLKATQSQLIQSEKMASLGELTAGIAHEIQNPLNFVNNFSEVNKELLVEMKDEMQKGNYDDAKEIIEDVIGNEEKINHHGKRADAIVKGMLQHSRTTGSAKEPTDVNKLADEYLRLAYHGLRAKDKSFNATLKTDFDESIDKVNIIPQDIGRVILNLITNAFYAVDEKSKQNIPGYVPTVSVSTKRSLSFVADPANGGREGRGEVQIKVTDNGNGIPTNIFDKIFQPFFTTKPTGQGTGLGLSLAYDIVKAHGGELKVQTKEGEGSTFIIQLPA